jgi:hypothetical protein
VSDVLVESPGATRAARRPDTSVLNQTRTAALVAAGVLILTGRGDLWTLALLLGLADGSMLTAFVVAAAGVGVLARTGSASLGDINGAQAVLGAAGFTGSTAAVFATWAGALALLAVARDRWTSAAMGLLAGSIVAGTALAGGLRSVAVFVLGLAAGAAVGWFVRAAADRRRWHVVVDVGMAAVAVALGVIAGYH